MFKNAGNSDTPTNLFLAPTLKRTMESTPLDEVLFLGGDGEARVGSPRVAGASVVGKVLEHGRGAKVRVFHYKKRKHNRKTRGHRQDFTALHIEKIQA